MRIDTAQRRARLVARHLLVPGARVVDPVVVADAVVALHATDPATVFLSAAARMTVPDVAAVEGALYQDRTLLRLLAMRRTMFVVSAGLGPVVDAGAARAVAAKQRVGLLRYLAEGGGWDERWLADAERAVVTALGGRGSATAAELAEDVPALRAQVVVAAGKSYEATQNVNSRVLRVMAAENRIRRDRPRGGWTSSQFRWSLAPALADLPVAAAQAELARCWLARYGPGTEADLAWWTGWTRAAARRALVAVGAEPVDLDEGTGFVLPDDVAPVVPVSPWVALLPALDPTPMGWQHRDWYLPAEHRAQLFDQTGNVGPTVWWDGRVVGGWAQRPDGQIVWELLDPAGVDIAAIETEAARLVAWIGDVRITPRFRTPLEHRLRTTTCVP
ncbi:MAG TPA: winged helix DNA-binding domain-containing protein [Pseudonocardiaceae bacterium]